MKIHYLNGNRLYYAVLAGGHAVIQDQAYLNKINVFPVADSDTGTNLASTMKAIAEGAVATRSIKATFKSIANAALSGAQGNSGIIFAQFIHGMSKETEHEFKLSTKAFGEAAKRAVHYLHKAIVTPVEGTMITVIRDWAEAVYQKRTQTSDFSELLTDSLPVAQKSLKETTQKLQVLARAGVVDAGAKGFVDFLEGIVHFMKKGKLSRIQKIEVMPTHEEIRIPSAKESLEYRYCSEALLAGQALDADKIRSIVQQHGGSAVVAGTEEKVRIHVHTNDPSRLFFTLKDYGAIIQIKAEDMRKQHEVAYSPKAKIALVTDSSCDLPQSVLDERQIQVVPFLLSFGSTQFLDKITITADQFYGFMKTAKVIPTTAQPPIQGVQNFLAFLASHYDSIIVLSISDKLTGFYNMCLKIAEKMPGKKISVINSRHISASLGLLVARASEKVLAGAPHDEIVKDIETWIPKTKLIVDVETLKYFVRGGRVSPVKGLVAKILNLKPIIELDKEGKTTAAGKSFSRKANMAKILKRIRALAQKEKIWGYAVVHARNQERANLYEQKLTDMLHRKPAFVMDVAPVIGVHSGIGAVAVALLFE
jgi:hypothetical protein